MINTLYLSRTGMLEPLGQSQVLSYLMGLSKQYRVTLISFERADDLRNTDHVAYVERLCEQHGIIWIKRRFHNRPRLLAQLWNLLVLFMLTIREVWRNKPALIHARSYIPAAAAWSAGRLSKTPYVFDMRSLWAEELVTSDRISRGSWLHRTIDWFEHRMLKDADAIVSLTRAAVGWLSDRHGDAIENRRMFVIPTCTDLARFESRNEVATGPLIFGCHGSVLNRWFDADLLGRTFERLAIQHPYARFEIITREPPQSVLVALRGAVSYQDRLEIFAESPLLIHDRLKLHDLSIFFYASGSASELGRSPTRMGEALGCGIPVLTNGQIGDVEELVITHNVGVVLASREDEAIDIAIERALDLARNQEAAKRCRSVAEKVYSLEAGTNAYHTIYENVRTGAIRPS
ncbi:MAG: glycosyltransferase [Pontixanthobacter sp.]